MTAERILVVGSGGRLGKELVSWFDNKATLTGLNHSQIDITSSHSIESALIEVKPTVVLNAAAMADVDRCEREVGLAKAVNRDGAANLAEICSRHETYLVHFSTDYVFDGKTHEPYSEKAEANPISVYGRTKLEGERLVLELCPSAAVVRVSRLYGASGGDFVSRLCEQDAKGASGPVKVVGDQVSAPTWSRDVARQLALIIENRLSGVVHAVAEGGVSKYDFAADIVNLLELNLELEKGKSSDFTDTAPRPEFSVLRNDRLNALGLNHMRPYKESLREFASLLKKAHGN